MDAMAITIAPGRFSRLWQLPLLLLSLILFVYSSHQLTQTSHSFSAGHEIRQAETLLADGRPDAAVERLNDLLKTQTLDLAIEARTHLLLAEGVAASLEDDGNPVATRHHQVIEHTRIALAQGATPDASILQRLGDAYRGAGLAEEALSAYRQAASLDSARSPQLQRRTIDLLIASEDWGPARASLEAYGRMPGVSNAERAWAIAEHGSILMRLGQYAEARSLLSGGVRLETDPIRAGLLHYRMGYAAWRMGDGGEAERLCVKARDLFRGRHPADAQAAVVLGDVAASRDDDATAIRFYDLAIAANAGAAASVPAHLGRGVSRVKLAEDDAGVADLTYAFDHVRDVPSVSSDTIAADWQDAFRIAATGLARRDSFAAAVAVLEMERRVAAAPSASFFVRLADVTHRWADSTESMIALADPAQRIRLSQQVRDLRTRSADADIACSRMLATAGHPGYAESLWRGVERYEKASDLPAAISSLELFVAERPDDPAVPEAMFRLGQACQAAGQFDKAITAYQINQFRFPQSPEAAKSALPLAQAYLAKGPEAFARAESVLTGLLNGQPTVPIDEAEQRRAAIELAQLQYRTGRFEQALGTLGQFPEPKNEDPTTGQMLFLEAECNRRVADTLAVAEANRSSSTAVTPAQDRSAEIRSRFDAAAALYSRAIVWFEQAASLDDAARGNRKLAYFQRADCLFAKGEFDQSIVAYEAAIGRYPHDPSSLAAQMQIVNAHTSLGRIDDAKAAGDRVRQLMAQLPADALAGEAYSLPRAYWQQWLERTPGL